MSSESLSCRDEASLDGLKRILGFTDSALETLRVPQARMARIHLAVDEAVTNIVRYAYPGRTGDVLISLARSGDRLTIDLFDAGVPFDPTEQPKPDLGAPLDARNVGGLGIHFMRKAVDRMRYSREDDRNHLTLAVFVGEAETKG